jgi:hypothetical protein
MLLQVGVEINGQKVFNSPKSVQAANKRLTVRTVKKGVQQCWTAIYLVLGGDKFGLALPHGDIARARGFLGQVPSCPELCTWPVVCISIEHTLKKYWGLKKFSI